MTRSAATGAPPARCALLPRLHPGKKVLDGKENTVVFERLCRHNPDFN
jgi:hypothetical protein